MQTGKKSLIAVNLRSKQRNAKILILAFMSLFIISRIGASDELSTAAAAGRIDNVQQLLNDGTSPNEFSTILSPLAQAVEGAHHAGERGNAEKRSVYLDIIKLLLEAGADTAVVSHSYPYPRLMAFADPDIRVILEAAGEAPWTEDEEKSLDFDRLWVTV